MGSSETHTGSQEHDRDSEKVSEAEIENSGQLLGSAQSAGFGAKAKRHCARRWWVHLIVFCLLFLIIALLLVYVGMPRIAQHGVNESYLELTDLEFGDPTPNTVVLTQKAILHSPSMYTPTLDPFNATSWLVTNGTFAAAPLTQILMPRIHALHPKSNVTAASQQVTLSNPAQIAEYATEILAQKNVSSALTGKTTLHEGKLPSININFNSTLTYAGLNGLAGFNVTNARVNISATPNFNAYAYIPNPSVITIAMGNVTFSLATADQGNVGNATINNMTLVPGNNTIPMTANIDQVKVAAARDAQGIVAMIITGTSSVYNGQHIPYYEAALASNSLHLNMNINQILADSGY